VRIDFDDLMTKYTAAPLMERSQFSPRAAIESAFEFGVGAMSLTSRRIHVVIETYQFDIESLAKHTFVLNGRELEIYTIASLATDESKMELVYAARSEIRGMSETDLRAAAEVATSLIVGHERWERYAPGDARKSAAEQQVRRITPNVDPTSVLVEEESRDRLAFLNEQKLGQCLPEPKRSVKLDGVVAYTDRESVKKRA
jgi:hypothetical protein